MAKLEEINPAFLKTIDTPKLSETHLRLHQWWNQGVIDKDKLFTAHDVVVAEMLSRDLQHNTPLYDEDYGKNRAKMEMPEPEDFMNSLPDKLVLIPDFISASGSFVDNHKAAKDIDLIIKAQKDEAGYNESLMKIPRALPEDVRGNVHFVPNPRGPISNNQPIYHLALVKADDRALRIIDDIPLSGSDKKVVKQETEIEAGIIEVLKPFIPLKAEESFFVFDDLWEKWAKAIVDEGNKIAVEQDFGGLRATIHKLGDEVLIFAEDTGQDITSILPEVVVAAKSQKPEEFILDSELIQLNEDGTPKLKQELSSIITGKETAKNIKANVFDILNLDGEMLFDQALNKRRELLDKNIKKANTLEVVPQKIAADKAELNKWIENVSREIGSQGAVLKDLSSTYDIDGITDRWSMLKNIVEVDSRIIGFRKVPLPKPEKRKMPAEEMEKLLPDLLKGSNTFSYRVAVTGPEGNEIPMESDKILIDENLTFQWDEKKQEWIGIEDPNIWTMASGWENRIADENGYGNTIPVQLDPSPKLGEIVSVNPSEVFEFEPGRFSWTFPVVQNIKPQAVLPGNVEDLKPVVVEKSPEIVEGNVREKRAENNNDLNIKIAKADKYFRYLLGVVMIPNYSDTDGDTITVEEIAKAEKAWKDNGAKVATNYRDVNGNTQYKDVTDSLAIERSIILGEEKKFRNVKGELKEYPEGTWMIRISPTNDNAGDEIWKRAISGEITGFSWEAPRN